MKFWLPLIILLTAISPNLEAETIDPREALTQQPYELELALFNVNFNRYKWTGDVVFNDYDPATDIVSGMVDWKANGSLFASREFSTRITEGGSYASVQVFPRQGTIWQGQFADDFLSARGRLDGVGTSDMEGVWTLTAVDLPPAGLLFIGALGTLMVIQKRKRSY